MRLSEFKLSPGDFENFGHDLQRPECVWVDDDGIWTSDLRGGIARVRADAEPVILGSGIAEPNGFSRRPDGSFLVAGIGDGILYHIAPDGETRKILDSIEGRPLGTINYACADGNDRVWVSVMTRQPQWQAALTRTERDGYILRVEENGKRCEIVADDLDLTNEVKVSPDGRYLYAAETLGCRIVRFRIRADGSLGNKETVGPERLGRGALPDGFTFDAWGNIWITIINQNALVVLDRRGDVHIVYCDKDDAAVETLAAGVDQRNGTVDHLVACSAVTGPLRLPTSIAFGGRDARTAYVGSLGLNTLPTFRLPETLE